MHIYHVDIRSLDASMSLVLPVFFRLRAPSSRRYLHRLPALMRDPISRYIYEQFAGLLARRSVRNQQANATCQTYSFPFARGPFFPPFSLLPFPFQEERLREALTALELESRRIIEALESDVLGLTEQRNGAREKLKAERAANRGLEDRLRMLTGELEDARERLALYDAAQDLALLRAGAALDRSGPASCSPGSGPSPVGAVGSFDEAKAPAAAESTRDRSPSPSPRPRDRLNSRAGSPTVSPHGPSRSKPPVGAGRLCRDRPRKSPPHQSQCPQGLIPGMIGHKRPRSAADIQREPAQSPGPAPPASVPAVGHTRETSGPDHDSESEDAYDIIEGSELERSPSHGRPPVLGRGLGQVQLTANDGDGRLHAGPGAGRGPGGAGPIASDHSRLGAAGVQCQGLGSESNAHAAPAAAAGRYTCHPPPRVFLEGGVEVREYAADLRAMRLSQDGKSLVWAPEIVPITHPSFEFRVRLVQGRAPEPLIIRRAVETAAVAVPVSDAKVRLFPTVGHGRPAGGSGAEASNGKQNQRPAAGATASAKAPPGVVPMASRAAARDFSPALAPPLPLFTLAAGCAGAGAGGSSSRGRTASPSPVKGCSRSPSRPAVMVARGTGAPHAAGKEEGGAGVDVDGNGEAWGMGSGRGRSGGRAAGHGQPSSIPQGPARTHDHGDRDRGHAPAAAAGAALGARHDLISLGGSGPDRSTADASSLTMPTRFQPSDNALVDLYRECLARQGVQPSVQWRRVRLSSSKQSWKTRLIWRRVGPEGGWSTWETLPV